jgi:ABC-type glycerol-3-phosphate transport system substrate-binding protein
MTTLLLRVLLVLGIGINVAFLIINLRPDRPHIGRRRKMRILLRAEPQRAEWVRQHEFAEFGELYDIDFEVANARDFDEVLERLTAERAHPTGIDLAAIDDEIADDLQVAGLVRPVQDLLGPAELSSVLDEDLPEAIVRSQRPDGKLWYLPRRAEIDVATYLRPAVEDAYLHWEQDRPAISAALAAANGVGLPKGYALERSPDAWDSYDLFVAAWYWAHHPAPWAAPSATAPAPRVAFRTGSNSDAVSDLLSLFYRHGFSDGDIGRTDTPAVIDALQWLTLFQRHHLLIPQCESAQGIDEDAVNEVFRSRSIAWAPLDQEDSLWLHGGARRDAPAGMPLAADLGWAVLPRGVSLEMRNNHPARAGRTFSFQEMQLWAVPIHSPNPTRAVALARFLGQRSVQRREAEAQGLLPIRTDLRRDYPILFRLDWMQHILDASYRQVELGSGDIPDEVVTRHLDQLYTRLRARVVRERPTTAPVTLAAIRAAVEEASHGR